MVNFKILEREIKFYNVKANNYLSKRVIDYVSSKQLKDLIIEREKLEIKILDSKCGIHPDKLLSDVVNKKAIRPSEVIVKKIIGGK